MDLKQLKYFTAVVDEGGMRKATETLHISQPSLSVSVQNLEAELGVALFTRKGRALHPTAEGFHFYRRARALLTQADKAKAEMLSMQALEKAEIRIGAPITIATYVLRDHIAAFLHDYPGVRISFKQMSGHEVERALLVGDIELGVLSRPPKSAEINAHVIGRRRICAFVREGHPLAHKAAISWLEILEEQIVSLPQNYVLNGITTHHASRFKKTPDFILESDIVPLLTATVRQSDAICLLLEDVAHQEEGLVRLDIIDDTVEPASTNTAITITACHMAGVPLSIGAEAVFNQLKKLEKL